MGFTESYFNPNEVITLSYQTTDRFLIYLNTHNAKALRTQYEAEFAIEGTIQMIQDGRIKSDTWKLPIREFNELDIKEQLGILLTTRLLNISKILYILEEDAGICHVGIERLRHIKAVLEEEFVDAYGISFDKACKHRLIGEKLCIPFDSFIKDDMGIYFQKKIINNHNLFENNRKDIFLYMSALYMKIEYEFLEADFNGTAYIKKSESDFMDYHNYCKAARRVLEELGSLLDVIVGVVDLEAMNKHRTTHRLIMFQ